MTFWTRLNELEAKVRGLADQNLCQRIENLEALTDRVGKGTPDRVFPTCPVEGDIDTMADKSGLALFQRVEELEHEVWSLTCGLETVRLLSERVQGLSGRMAMDGGDPRTVDAWTPLQELVKELAGRVAALEDKAGVKPKGRKKNG